MSGARLTAAVASLAAGVVASAAFAPGAHAEPQAAPHRFYARGGVLHVAPFTDSRELELSDVDGPASLAISDGPITGSGSTVDAVTTPGIIVGYLTPWLGDRIAIETVIAPPLHLTFRATGTLADESIAPEALGIPTGVPPLGPELGEADAAPPVVTVTYRFVAGEVVQAYAGLGGTVLITYNARATNPALTAGSEPRLHIDPSPGLVVQTGIDVRLWQRVRARVDVKYIAFMKAHATVENLRMRTPDLPLFESVDVGTATLDLTVNPLVVLAGVGVDFW